MKHALIGALRREIRLTAHEIAQSAVKYGFTARSVPGHMVVAFLHYKNRKLFQNGAAFFAVLCT